MGVMSQVCFEASRQFGMIKPYLLSHHPMCSIYSSDMVKIRNRHYCKGCLVGYGSAIIFFLAALVVIYYHMLPLPSIWWPYFVVSALFSLPQFLRAYFPSIPPAAKTLVKISVGVSISSALMGVVYFPFSVGGRVLAFLFLYALYGALAGLMRVKYIKRTCRLNCPYKGDWMHCYGFRYVNEYDPSDGVDASELEM